MANIVEEDLIEEFKISLSNKYKVLPNKIGNSILKISERRLHILIHNSMRELSKVQVINL